MNNFIYSLVFLELTIWFRVILGSEPIGLLAMNLTDGFFLILFCFAIFCFKRLAIKRQWHDWFNKLFVYQWFFVVILTILTSGFAVLINYSFLLKLYSPNWGKKEIVTLLPIIFGLNLAKYILNGILYFAVFKPTAVLARHYQA